MASGYGYQKSSRLSTKQKASLIAALVVAGLVFYLYNVVHTPHGKAKAYCSLVIDQSASVSNESFRQLFKTMATDTVNACSSREAELVVWRVDQSALKVHEVGSYALYGRGQAPLYRKKQAAAERRRANRDIRRVLKSGAQLSMAGGSDIALALKNASDSLSSGGKNSNLPKFMIVLSDGLQISDGASVASLNSITSVPRNLALSDTRLLGGLNLQNVNFEFYGVNTRTQATTNFQLPTWFEGLVHQFWNEFVQIGGGRICNYDIEVTEENVLKYCAA